MTISRDATQDCSANSTSATSLAASFPGGAATALRLLIAVARIETAKVNVTRPSGSTDLFALDMSGGPCLIAVAKIAAGTETGMTFSHNQTATGMTVGAYQYTGALSPLAVDQTTTNPGDFAQHSAWPTGTTGATAQADELAIEAAALAGVATSPGVATGTLIGNLRSGELLIAERILSATGTVADTFSWTNNNFVIAGVATIKAALTAAIEEWWTVS